MDQRGMRAWRFLDTGFQNGAENMAIDEALLRGVVEETTPPTVRVFGWAPPTVSTGHSQDVSRELDLEACGRAGFGVVRRPTGGRAVLHAGELTYSVVGRSGEEPLGGAIMETYLAISSALVEGLSLLGIDADLEQTSTPGRPRGEQATPPCFASAGRFEVVVGGRKLIGSAQRRMSGAVLQHGSLLIDASHTGIADVMRIETARRNGVRRLLAERTTDLESLTGRAIRFQEVARAVKLGFERAWGIELESGSLSKVEEERASSLATDYVI